MVAAGSSSAFNSAKFSTPQFASPLDLQGSMGCVDLLKHHGHDDTDVDMDDVDPPIDLPPQFTKHPDLQSSTIYSNFTATMMARM